MKKVLVLGGAGFIGSHLVERLLADGHDVSIVDNFKYCYADNLDRASKNPNCHIYEGDVTRRGFNIPGLFDEIYHLAGVVATPRFTTESVAALWASLLPMEKLLRYQERNPQVKLLFTSSSEVYGDAQVYPQPESYWGNVNPIGYRCGYDEGKRATEALIMGWKRERAASSAIVRLFNTYGPRQQRHGCLVSAMVYGALFDRRITVHRPGTQTRTLLYVGDLVRALLLAMERQYEEPINIGGAETFEVQEVAEMVRARVSASHLGGGGSQAEIVYGDPNPDDVQARRPDISLAQKVLGWQPSTPFEQEGLAEVVDYWVRRGSENAVGTHAVSRR